MKEKREVFKMFHHYIVSMRSDKLTNQYSVYGVSNAMRGYHTAVEFMKTLGIDAVMELIDAETGSVLASTEDFEI